jgi:hypothetical protein
MLAQASPKYPKVAQKVKKVFKRLKKHQTTKGRGGVGVWRKIAHLKVTQEMMRDGAYFSSSSLLANHQRSQ